MNVCRQRLLGTGENQALECGSWTKPRESDVLFLICGLEDLQQSTPWNIESESQFKNRSNILAHQTVIIKSQYSPWCEVLIAFDIIASWNRRWRKNEKAFPEGYKEHRMLLNFCQRSDEDTQTVIPDVSTLHGHRGTVEASSSEVLRGLYCAAV